MTSNEFTKRLLNAEVSLEDVTAPMPARYVDELFVIDAVLSKVLNESTPEQYAEFLDGLRLLLKTAPQRFKVEREMRAEGLYDESFWAKAWGGAVN